MMSLSKRVTRCSNATSSERSLHLYKGALSVPGCLCRSPQTFRVSPLPLTPTLAWTFAKDKDLFSGSGVPAGSRCWRGCPDRPRYGHTPRRQAEERPCPPLHGGWGPGGFAERFLLQNRPGGVEMQGWESRGSLPEGTYAQDVGAQEHAWWGRAGV